MMGTYFGAFAAILIGAEAGTTDLASGVFRDLVATGRSRTTLFLVRIPAAVTIAVTLTLSGYAVAIAAAYAGHGSAQAPTAGLALEFAAWVALCTVVQAPRPSRLQHRPEQLQVADASRRSGTRHPRLGADPRRPRRMANQHPGRVNSNQHPERRRAPPVTLSAAGLRSCSQPTLDCWRLKLVMSNFNVLLIECWCGAT